MTEENNLKVAQPHNNNDLFKTAHRYTNYNPNTEAPDKKNSNTMWLMNHE